MCDERGVDLVVWDLAEGSVVGETSLVAKIEADTNKYSCSTLPPSCAGPDRDEEEVVGTEASKGPLESSMVQRR